MVGGLHRANTMSDLKVSPAARGFALACACVLCLAAAETPAADRPSSVLGDGWGLDHVILGLADPHAVKDVFAAELGFTPHAGIKFPGLGLDQATISLPPTYLELLWVYQEPTGDNPLPVATVVREKVASGGGVAAYMINVSPAVSAADAMRGLGLRVTLPASPTIRGADGKEQPGPWQFVDIDPQDQATQPLGVPGGAGVNFLEYRENSARLSSDWFVRMVERAKQDADDPRRAAGEIHANTARRLHAVWVVVPSKAAAVAQAERFGFTAGVERHIRALGATGREVQCGAGTIVFFGPPPHNSRLAKLVEHQGFGPFGISLTVADLKTAHTVIQQSTHKKFAIEHSGGGDSFIVPAEVAAGAFVEFVQ